MPACEVTISVDCYNCWTVLYSVKYCGTGDKFLRRRGKKPGKMNNQVTEHMNGILDLKINDVMYG